MHGLKSIHIRRLKDMLTFKQFCRIEEESTAKRMEKAYQTKQREKKDQETTCDGHSLERVDLIGETLLLLKGSSPNS